MLVDQRATSHRFADILEHGIHGHNVTPIQGLGLDKGGRKPGLAARAITFCPCRAARWGANTQPLFKATTSGGLQARHVAARAAGPGGETHQKQFRSPCKGKTDSHNPPPSRPTPSRLSRKPNSPPSTPTASHTRLTLHGCVLAEIRGSFPFPLQRRDSRIWFAGYAQLIDCA